MHHVKKMFPVPLLLRSVGSGSGSGDGGLGGVHRICTADSSRSSSSCAADSHAGAVAVVTIGRQRTSLEVLDELEGMRLDGQAFALRSAEGAAGSAAAGGGRVGVGNGVNFRVGIVVVVLAKDAHDGMEAFPLHPSDGVALLCRHLGRS